MSQAVKQDSESEVTITPEAQQEILEAQRSIREAKTFLESASAKYGVAEQRVAILVYKSMAELKLSPKEWEVIQDEDGSVKFKKIKPISD